MELLTSLKQHFGFDSFRPGQHQVIEQLIQGHSSLAVFPTGSGKSLCYQLAALHLPHLTLVISPLLALIKDQLDFLHRNGISAVSIDSSQSPQQQQAAKRQIKEGQCRILMVSVERFQNEYFRQFLEHIPISLMVVDEAHCISEWGHNFRPDYLKLPDYQTQFRIPQVLLLTATATEKVQKDMAQKFSIQPNHCSQTGFYRANLTLRVVDCATNDKSQFIQSYLSHNPGKSGIVYVTLQKTAEQLASELRKSGVNCQAYHAGLTSENRAAVQQQFMQDQCPVIIATIAFGMGIDKANIGFVIHYDLPKSLENYSQEIGRAGRDGNPAECITLANLDSLPVLENFIYADTPELSAIEQLLTTVQHQSREGRWETRILALSKETNIRQLALKTLMVQLELMGHLRPLFSYHSDVRFKCLQSQQEILQRFSGERQLFVTALFHHTQFKKVWGELNMSALLLDYQCERSRVNAALQWMQDQDLIQLESKQLTQVYQVNPSLEQIESISATLSQYFEQKQSSELKRIQQLLGFLGSEQCLSHQLAAYFNDPHGPAQCGHCSSCAHQVPELKAYQLLPEFSQRQISQWLQELNQRLPQPTNRFISCRFLAGLSLPVFTRYKVTKLAGFGKMQQVPFAQITSQVDELIQ